MKLGYFLPIFCILFNTQLLAADSSNCEVKSYNELIRCHLQISPEMNQLNIDGQSRIQSMAKPQQWINPDLETEYIAHGADQSELSAQLMFNLSLNGKRSAEIDLSQLTSQFEQSELKIRQQQLQLEIILQLHRLAQLQQEIVIATEANETFTKIIQSFQHKQISSPEARVSTSVFKMALSSQQFLLVKLQSEKEKLLQNLEISLGLDQSKILKYLPPDLPSWPKVSEDYDLSVSPAIQRAELEHSMSQKTLEIEKSSSWPDLKIGPSFKIQRDSLQTENWAGVSLSFPLPIFSLNQTGRQAAHLAEQASAMNLSLAKLKAVAIHTRQVHHYQDLIQTLQGVQSSLELQQEHAQLESLFFKGLISSSLVIEAHRQLYELETNRHELQLDALKTYGELLITEKRFNGVIL